MQWTIADGLGITLKGSSKKYHHNFTRHSIFAQTKTINEMCESKAKYCVSELGISKK